MSDSPISLTFLLFSLESDGKINTTLPKIFSFLFFSLSFFCPDLMEIVQEQRHECKVCKKRFISGSTLGGHVRCHMATNPALSDKNPTESDIGFEEDGGGQTAGYGLRENPKKSWRLSGSKHTAPNQEQEGGQLEHVCKVCGKGFNSSKALFGHMRHHSRQQNPCRECGKGFCSSRALSGHMRCHSKRFDRAIDASKTKTSSCQSQDEETSCPARRKRSQRYKIDSNPSSSNFNDSSSATLTLSEPELEEGAMCLMLLSRADRRSWEESNSVSEFSDNNSAIPEPKPSHQNTPIVKDDEDENFVSKGYGGETSKMLLIEKGMQRSESSGQEYGGNALSEKKTTEIGNCDSGFELEVFAKEFFKNDGSKKKKKKKKRKKLDFESHHESTEKKFQSEIKIKSTAIDSDLGDIDVQSIGLGEASSESQKHNSSKRAKCEPYEADSEDKKRGCAARNNKRIYKCSSKVFQSRRPRHLALASNSKRCGKSIHTDGKANSKVEEYKEENPIEKAAGVSELKRRSKDYECGVCFRVFASGQALGGHKRAHYYARSFETVQEEEEEEEEEEEGATLVQREHFDVLDIFDLNLHTAPEEGGGFKAWCFRL